MGPTAALSDPDGSHVGPMNLAIRERIKDDCSQQSACPYAPPLGSRITTDTVVESSNPV